MGRFVRDFGFLASVVLSPLGVYLLWVGTGDRTASASAYVIAGAGLTAAALLGIFASIRQHRILLDHIRYAHGKRRVNRLARLAGDD